MRTVFTKPAKWIASKLTHRIANRLIAVFVLLCLVLIAGLSGLYYYNLTSEKRQDYIEYNLNTLRQGNLNFAGAVSELDHQMKTVFASDWVWDQIVSARTEPGDYLVEQQMLGSLLNLYNSLGGIDRVVLYLPGWSRLYVMDDNTLESGGGSVSRNEFVIPGVADADIPWYAGALETPTELLIAADNAPYPFFRLHSEKKVYRFARVLLNPFDSRPIAALCLDMDRDRLSEMLSEMLLEGEDIFLLAGGGDVIYGQAEAPLSSAAIARLGEEREGFYREVGPAPSTVLYARTGVKDWFTVKSISDSVLNRRLHSGFAMYLCFSLLMVLLGVATVILTSIRIVMPIKQLTAALNSFDGTAPPAVAVTRRDELGELQRRFGEMGWRIHHMIHTEYILKIREKDAAINAVKARMNPHFLNNALHTISALAVRSDNADVETAVQKLKAILQYDLNNSTGLTTLRAELKNTRNYLDIQQYRYPDRLRVNYEISPEALSAALPAFALQPVVENCFRHGMGSDRAILRIHISAHRRDGAFIVKIADNGKGFDPAQIPWIMERFQREYAQVELGATGNGLLMVNSLIKLSMGPEYGVIIANNEPCGAQVLLCLPLPEERGTACTRP